VDLQGHIFYILKFLKEKLYIYQHLYPPSHYFLLYNAKLQINCKDVLSLYSLVFSLIVLSHLWSIDQSINQSL